MGIRDEQKEQRRQLIIVKAAELFAKNGFTETKISDIAKAADMSVGLLFHYFESKEKLYEELVKMGVEFSSSPYKLNFNDPLDYFRMSIDGIFDASKKQPFVLYMFVLMGQARRSESIPPHIRELAMSIDQVSRSAEIIEAGQQYGCFRKGDPNLLAFTFWSAVQGIMEQIAVTPELFTDDKPYPETDWILSLISGEKNTKGENGNDRG